MIRSQGPTTPSPTTVNVNLGGSVGSNQPLNPQVTVEQSRWSTQDPS